MNADEMPSALGRPIWPIAPSSGGALGPHLAPGQQTYGGVGGNDLNLTTLIRILVNWRWLILSAIGVGLVAAVTVSLLTTRQYRATALLEVNPPTIEIMDQGKPLETSNDSDYLATQYGLLHSRSLAERVAQELNLASNPQFMPRSDANRDVLNKSAAGKLLANFTVMPIPNSRLINISYVSEQPDLAAQITNSFADSFIASNLERTYEASSYARHFLERQIARTKGELERSERDLVGYAQAQGIINTGTDKTAGSDAASLQGTSLVALNEALAAAQVKRISAEEAYRQSRAHQNTAEVNQSTEALRAQRAALQADYSDKLTRMKPDYPDMVSLQSRIDELTKQISAQASTIATGRSNSLLEDYHAAADAERSLQARVAELKGSVLDLRGRSIRYTILQREVDTNRALYDALLQRYKEIGVAGGVGKNTTSIVDRANPGGLFKPNLELNILIGLALGIVGGVGMALALELLNDTIETQDDVRQKLKLAALGVIPRKREQNAIIDELQDQTSAVAEAYASLRTSLQFSTENGAPKSVLVTSARSGEGKSSTALALAQSFARLGNRVLLIDADLRKPAFVTGNEDIGLSNLLTNSDPLGDHVLETEYENLWLVPCGRLPPSPAELLATQRMRALIAEAATVFDMVVIDGPPVLGLADAPLLGSVCRGTVLVVESRKTRTRIAVDAVNRLHASSSQIVGAVLTKYRSRAQGYGYGYGYGYGEYEPYKYGQFSRDPNREIRLIASKEQ